MTVFASLSAPELSIALEDVFNYMNLAGLEAPSSGEKFLADADVLAAEGPRKAARILVVDDEARVRLMIGATLEAHGYDVQLVSSVREAMETLERNAFD